MGSDKLRLVKMGSYNRLPVKQTSGCIQKHCEAMRCFAARSMSSLRMGLIRIANLLLEYDPPISNLADFVFTRAQ
jgi:hypothetical protein